MNTLIKAYPYLKYGGTLFWCSVGCWCWIQLPSGHDSYWFWLGIVISIAALSSLWLKWAVLVFDVLKVLTIITIALGVILMQALGVLGLVIGWGPTWDNVLWESFWIAGVAITISAILLEKRVGQSGRRA